MKVTQSAIWVKIVGGHGGSSQFSILWGDPPQSFLPTKGNTVSLIPKRFQWIKELSKKHPKKDYVRIRMV